MLCAGTTIGTCQTTGPKPYWSYIGASILGLDPAIKPLLRHSTTEEFDSPPDFFADVRKAPKMKTAFLSP
eukprot:3252931-Pyramimonas_sp.AAC.1